MKLQIMSDLHLEFGGDHAGFKPTKTDADVVVLAGDIATGTGACKWIEETFPDKRVIYIAGNHEGYRYDLYEVMQRLKDWADGTENVRFLDNEWTEIEGQWFFGGTLWTDFALDGQPGYAKMIAKQCMNDYFQIKWKGERLTPDMTQQWHADAVKQLGHHHPTHDGPMPRIVITHHLPSRQSIDPDYRSSEANPAYATDLEWLMYWSGAPKLWVHGHTHRSKDYVCNQTRVVCNPRGYPYGDGKNWAFDPGLVVEV